MNSIKRTATLFYPASLPGYSIYLFSFLFFVFALSSSTKAKAVSSVNFNMLATYSNTKFDKEIKDSLNIPKVVKPDDDGILKLNSKVGKALGPEIKYMPEWNAFGWFTTNDYVVWQVEVPQNGTYVVYLEWSVSDEEAGKPFIFETNTKKLKGVVGKTGSWETFKSEKIGRVQLKSGLQTMKFLPDSKFQQGALLDLREIRLVPVE